MAYDFNTVVGIVPAKGFKEQVKTNTLKARYGDGYMQRSVEGINSFNSSFALSFTNRSVADAQKIVDFLEARKGFEKFTWTPPYKTVSISVYCEKWEQQYVAHGHITVTATFVKVFE
jgi:phage-related protein